jgi:hypothetical protein
MPAPPAVCHKLGAVAFVRPSGSRDWLEARVVGIEPLEALIVEEHPVWRGARLSRRDGLIRVDPKFWPTK